MYKINNSSLTTIESETAEKTPTIATLRDGLESHSASTAAALPFVVRTTPAQNVAETAAAVRPGTENDPCLPLKEAGALFVERMYRVGV